MIQNMFSQLPWLMSRSCNANLAILIQHQNNVIMSHHSACGRHPAATAQIHKVVTQGYLPSQHLAFHCACAKCVHAGVWWQSKLIGIFCCLHHHWKSTLGPNGRGLLSLSLCFCTCMQVNFCTHACVCIMCVDVLVSALMCFTSKQWERLHSAL